MIQLAALIAKPILGKFAPDAAKDKMAAVQTPPEPREQISGRSETTIRGEVDHGGKPLGWPQYDWPAPRQARSTCISAR